LRRIRCTRHVALLGEMTNAYNILVGKPEGKKGPFGRPRRRWEDNIRTDLSEMDEKVWTEFIWLIIGTSSWPL